MPEVINFPKLYCPFPTTNGKIPPGAELKEEFAWVADPEVRAAEKLDGTNVGVLIENAHIVLISNRAYQIPFFQTQGGALYHRITSGVLDALERGWLGDLPDGYHYGELIGPRFNGNRHNAPTHMWVPFVRLCRKCTYRFPLAYQDLSDFMREGLRSKFEEHVLHHEDSPFAEGVVFTHPDGRRAKLRRDHFEWFSGAR